MRETKDTPSVAYIRHRIMRFRESVDETSDHYADLRAFGRYSAAALYVEKAGIPSLIDDPALGPAEKDELTREFRDALSALEALKRETGDSYRQKLRDELLIYTDAYAAAICHSNLGNPVSEFGDDPCMREVIGILLRELEGDTDLDSIGHLIRTLDEGSLGMKDPEARDIHAYPSGIARYDAGKPGNQPARP